MNIDIVTVCIKLFSTRKSRNKNIISKKNKIYFIAHTNTIHH